ncbi:NEAT domain-containing protein [Paenibacillus camerounensis]|uniref:NEAT domain-containing protein n=1 Tax=Paenibacillus camerounensis TaxID=1243663 RepID=UPI0005A603F1|nr:NEAT domain-containing protein [Paenibacillus camerounensis]
MNKTKFGLLFRMLAVVLFISSVLQPLGSASAESAKYKDGVYELPYSILKDGTSDNSVMETYVVKPAKLEVKDGKNYVSFTVKQSKEITGLKLTTADGVLSEGTITSNNTDNNERTVQFELGDLTAANDGWVKIEWPEFFYNNEYNVDFKFDTSLIPAAPVEPAEPVLSDGNYTIEYSVLHATQDKDSSMKSYFGTPATLTVKNGQKTVTVNIIKDSSTIKEVTVDGQTASTVSENTEANTRVISFPVDKLQSVLSGTVHIVTVVNMGGTPTTYDMTHTVRYKFNADSITAVQPEVPAEPVLSDGNYTIEYSVLHATQDKDSSMKSYFGTPATLTVKDGQKSVSINVIKDSSTIKEVTVDGQTASTVSENTEANTRVISFPVDKLQPVLNGTVHIVTVVNMGGTPTTYDMTHTVRYKFNADSITAVKDETPPVVTPDPTPTPTPTPTPGTGTDTGGGTAPTPAALADGFYSIDYTILKDGSNEPSMMDTYTVHPGTLIVSGGQKYLAITLKQSKEITGFTVEQGAVSVIASNAAANTRTVRFPVSGTGAKLNAWVKIVWPEFNYDSSYDVDILVGSTVGGQVSDPAGTIDAGTPAVSATPAPSASAAPAPTQAPAAGNTGTANGGNTIAVSLKDLNGHWAQAAIEKAVQAGLVNGYDDNSFRPNNPVSRAEFAVLISRALKLSGAGEGTVFSDQSSIPAWANEGVAQIAAMQIIGGYEDGSFRPSRQINRAELAVIVARAKGLTIDPAAVPTFSDLADIPAWARPYVAAAEQAGLVSGKGGNRYAAGDYATRAEAVSLLVKLLEQ